MTPEPATHRLKWRRWTSTIHVLEVIDDGRQLRLIGYGPEAPKDGDYMVIEMPHEMGGAESRYRALRVFTLPVPADLWLVEAEFDPRVE